MSKEIERRVVDLIQGNEKRAVAINSDVIARYDRKALAERLLGYVIDEKKI